MFRRDNPRTCWRRMDNIFAKPRTYSRIIVIIVKIYAERATTVAIPVAIFT